MIWAKKKIDIILYSDDPKAFIINALSPTKVVSVTLDETDRKAIVKVPEDQLSLAIGKQGQNVRLAAKLSNWNIDIVSADESKDRSRGGRGCRTRTGRSN